jgi:tRNA threonylcarbamoyladenosine biosynthesis protein TsaB
MRVLGIETSSRRGSVALLDGEELVARAAHVEPNAHAEQLAPLLERVLADAGCSKASLDRIGVGMGPGSFTGLRVGIAFAQGIALGLDIPLIGVSSLQAMSLPCPPSVTGLRVPLLDARRGEVFAAAYAANGEERLAPCALPRATVLGVLGGLLGTELALLGEVVAELGATAACGADELTLLPDAVGAALLAARAELGSSLTDPQYVRDAGATPGPMPPSPFGSKR